MIKIADEMLQLLFSPWLGEGPHRTWTTSWRSPKTSCPLGPDSLTCHYHHSRKQERRHVVNGFLDYRLKLSTALLATVSS